MKKEIIGSILKSIAGGTIAPATGLIKGVASVIKDSKKETPHSPEGSIDIVKIGFMIISGGVILSLITGWITPEEFKAIFNQLKQLNVLDKF